MSRIAKAPVAPGSTPIILPLNFVRPVARTKFAWAGVLRIMAGIVRLLARFVFGARRIFTRPLNTLLAESDSLYLVAFLGHDDVALGRMARRLLRLVIAGNASASKATVFLH